MGSDLATPPERLTRLAALRTTEALLADAAGSVDLASYRATLLDGLGRTEEAKQAYLAALFAAPDHAPTLNGLGALLARTGYRSAARIAFAQAATCHPEQPLGHINLANTLHEAGEIDAARAHFEAALRTDPDLAEAHQGLGQICADAGDRAEAERHWRIGYRNRVFTPWPYRGDGAPIRVLLLASVIGGNLPVRVFLDDRIFAVTVVAMEFHTPDLPLPPHDLIFNAIGDADLCGQALAATTALLRQSAAPVINPPVKVLATGRVQNSRLLRGIPGVVTPHMATLPRAALASPDGAAVLAEQGFGWPVLLRAPGFHTGQHFLRVNTADALAAAVASLPGETILAIAYLDATWADGKARKGRVLFVDGRIYPLHWAISQNWKIHYFSADMTDTAEHRAEEARFLADMPDFLGAPAMAALEAIADRLGLDYGGIDFGLGVDGEILLFEANATMAIVPPQAGSQWDYRRAAIDQPLQATRQMLVRRAK
jgi:hypothetical protein